MHQGLLQAQPWGVHAVVREPPHDEHERLAAGLARARPQLVRPLLRSCGRTGERLNQPDVPAKLSMLTSLFALTMGALWTLRASLELRLPQASLRLLRRAAAA